MSYRLNDIDNDGLTIIMDFLSFENCKNIILLNKITYGKITNHPYHWKNKYDEHFIEKVIQPNWNSYKMMYNRLINFKKYQFSFNVQKLMNVLYPEGSFIDKLEVPFTMFTQYINSNDNDIYLEFDYGQGHDESDYVLTIHHVIIGYDNSNKSINVAIDSDHLKIESGISSFKFTIDKNYLIDALFRQIPKLL
ncbi:MAG: hypothetical protein Edafosvirus2_39 [Edafosvirus sp.]|uniref:Uncharacterized protein n=1 Tax=Edafosvirus sp. TaxID=2487765 RepID=A0A3G4ZSI1_9VIRU|nr:MAG: hypothetical protein Edafosvirus2_39 [Edafosvirus sp.]